MRVAQVVLSTVEGSYSLAFPRNVSHNGSAERPSRGVVRALGTPLLL